MLCASILKEGLKIIFLWSAAFFFFAVSFIADRSKTFLALKRSWKIFSRMLPMFVVVLVLTSLSLSFLGEERIINLLSGKGLWLGSILAGLVGSITAMPGFVAFPLAGILARQGIPYTVLAAFTTTLMMVGFVTFPLEKSFLGTRVALARNLASLVVAFIVSVAMGIVFGEIL